MFCPGCGLQASDDLKFCRQCGANLRGVRDAMTPRSIEGKFDWANTWVGEMIFTQEELERRRGVTPEEKRLKEEKKRLNEIKGGVITSFVGIGVMIAFYFFFGAVARQEPADGDILRSLWLLGIIPFLIGVGLFINGFFISRRLVKLEERQTRTSLTAPPEPIAPPAARPIPLEAKTTDQLIANAESLSGFSVTEDTTAHLPEPVATPPRRETG
ncbi:MAG: hypothetical protein JMDDDDMK_03073 [Acidobacteria bacterium]|nr:hypothetical protein [Acidobacteriota bacterium]